MKLIDAAVEYAQRGRPVFPTAGKIPRTAHGLNDATTDEATIIEWWTRWPTAGIGLVTGHGIIAVDVDGDVGRESLRELERMHGGLPTTLVNVTARGAHYIYREPEGVRLSNRAGLRAGIDLRASGGYIVVWPSRHPSGPVYEWAHAPIARPPKWLLDILAPSVPPVPMAPVRASQADGDRARAWALAGLKRLADEVAAAVRGTRNHSANRALFIAGTWIASGFITRDEAAHVIGDATVRAGLRGREVHLLLREGGPLEQGQRHPSPGPTSDRADWRSRRAA